MLGFSARLPPATVEPFVRSLQATGYRGRLGLIVAHYDEHQRAALERLADFCIDVDGLYSPRSVRTLQLLHWARRTRGVRRAYPAAFILNSAAARERDSLDRWETLEFQLEGLQALRYGHYYDALQGIARDAEHVLLTDLRDVLFQADPFDPPVDALETFLEDPSRTIGGEPFNRRWIQALYGRATLTAMTNLTASCSGTVIGPRVDILNYLTEMQLAITWRRRPLGSHDQGVHNRLLHSGRLRAKVIPNEHGRVLTMGGMSDIRRGPDGRILNADGTVPAVLHQYDRHPTLAHELLRAVT